MSDRRTRGMSVLAATLVAGAVSAFTAPATLLAQSSEAPTEAITEATTEVPTDLPTEGKVDARSQTDEEPTTRRRQQRDAEPGEAAGLQRDEPRGKARADQARTAGGNGNGRGNAHGKRVSAAARGEIPPRGNCRNHGHWVSTVARGGNSCNEFPRPAGEDE